MASRCWGKRWLRRLLRTYGCHLPFAGGRCGAYGSERGDGSEQPPPRPASGGYIDWKGVKRTGTSLPANFARSSALGSPRSSP